MKSALALLGLLLAAAPAVALPRPFALVELAAPSAPVGDELPTAVADELERALARGFDTRAHDELFRLAMIEWADIAPLTSHLVDIELAGEGAEGAAGERARHALWLRAHLVWRFGDVNAARRALEELVGLVPTAEVWWELGCVHDALDARDAARAAYTAALEAGPSAELEGRLRLRVAMLSIGLGGDDEQQAAAAANLVAFGKEAARSEEERNRAAIVLALDGRHAEALELFTVGSAAADSAESFRRELRLCEWALAAKDAERAKRHADAAVLGAGPARDRRYALGLLVEAHRLDDSLDALIERLATEPERSNESTQVWIELLRETGRFEDAHAWFRASEEGGDGELDEGVRRQLLDLCREWGREDLLLAEYTRLVAAHPLSIVWREGLSRFLLEKGRADEARAAWSDYLAEERFEPYLLTAADALAGLGLDDLAIAACERCIERGRDPYGAMLQLCSIHRERGRLPLALAALERMHVEAPADAPERLGLAEAFEELGALERSVEVLEGVRAARGAAGAAEDLDMRLAWMLSEVDREEDALALWDELWRRIEAPGRRRYVEERLMSVASSLGVLADIAIDLETKLARGEADDRDAGLLVQLYSRVNDPVSATEVLEMFLAGKGGSKLKELEEKARIFLQCNDYYRYERTLREQMALDPDGAPDYLRQLAMSALERGQAQEARAILDELLRRDRNVDSSEFEAGVLALAGLRQEAAAAYRRGIVANSDRIENYLLLANVMRDLGQRERAVGMFQYLAERADEDDLFTIAIDGLLNMEASENALRWARRCALERIAGRHDKVYLYQLVADLSEQLEDQEFMVRALEGALPISAERRVSLLRELMDLARRRDDKLRFGRRLVNSGQLVPPDVYLQLGEAFLEADDVASATRTFAVADSLQESSAFTIDVARVLERSSYLRRARDAYQRALIGRDVDVGLIVKLGEIHEQIGDDPSASAYYRRAADLLLLRQPLTATKAVDIGSNSNPYDYWSTINVDEYDQYLARCYTGLVTTLAGSDEFAAAIAEGLALLDAELAESLAEGSAQERELAQFPRVARRADVVRRLALDGGQPLLVEDLDLRLVATFDGDERLLGQLVEERLRRSQHGAARRLWERADVAPQRRAALAHLFEGGVGETGGAAALRALPRLVAEGRRDDVRTLLQAVLDDPTAAAAAEAGVLHAASDLVGDDELAFRILRSWLDRVLVTSQEYEARRVMEIAAHALPADLHALLLDHAAYSIKSDDVRASALLGLLLELEKTTSRDLVTDEDLDVLVERAFETRGYWAVYPFFKVVPPEGVAGLLRRTLAKLPEGSRASFLVEIFTNQERPLTEDSRDLIVGAFKESIAKVEQPEYMVYTLQQAVENEHDPAVARQFVEIFTERWGAGIAFDGLRVRCLVGEGRHDEALALLIDMYGRGRPADDDWEARQAFESAEAAVVENHLDALVEHLLAEGERTNTLAAARERCEALVQQSGEPFALLEFRRRCAQRWPGDAAVLEALADELKRHDHLVWEYLAVLEQRAALPAEDEKAFDELRRFWNKLDHEIEEARWKELASAAKAERRAREKAERDARRAAEKAAKEAAEAAAADSSAVGAADGAGDGAADAATGGASASATAAVPPTAPTGAAASVAGAAPVGGSTGGVAVPLASLSATSTPAASLAPAVPAVPLAGATVVGGSTSASGSTSSSAAISVPAAPIQISVVGAGQGAVSVQLAGQLAALGYVVEGAPSAARGSDEAPSEKAPPAQLMSFTELLESGDADGARAIFRRMWRSFPVDPNDNVFYWYGGGAGFGGWNGVPDQWQGEMPAEAQAVLAPEPEPDAAAAATEGAEGSEGAPADGADAQVDGDEPADVDGGSVAGDAPEAIEPDAADATEAPAMSGSDGADASGEVVDGSTTGADTASADAAADGAQAAPESEGAIAVELVDLADVGEVVEVVEVVDEGAQEAVDELESESASEVEPGDEGDGGGDEPSGDSPRAKRRGGLDDFQVPERGEPPVLTSTYDVLACTEVGRAEMWRQLQTRTPEQLDHCGPLFEALAEYERRRVGAEAALDALLARFADGSAGRIELELLLQHLEAGHGAERDDVRAVLDQLLSAVAPSDSRKLAAVARLLARAGRVDACAALLPYCATLAARGGRGDPYGGIVFVFDSSASAVPANVTELIQIARDTLEGERRHAVVARILEQFAPLDLSSDYDPYRFYYDPFGGQADEWYTVLVVQTWMEELEPRAALERCRGIVDGIAAWDGSTAPARQAAKMAARLAARAGEPALAARLVEVALARHEVDLSSSYRMMYFGSPSMDMSRGSLSNFDIAELFPEDTSVFPDVGAYALAVVQSLVRLVDDGTCLPDQGLRAIGVGLARLAGTSQAAEIDALVAALSRHVATQPEAMLWVLDGAVRAGRMEPALAIERAFAEARLLRIDRIEDAVARAEATRGPAAALELGELFGAYTATEAFALRLAGLADAAGLAERAEHWRGVAATIDAL